MLTEACEPILGVCAPCIAFFVLSNIVLLSNLKDLVNVYLSFPLEAVLFLFTPTFVFLV